MILISSFHDLTRNLIGLCLEKPDRQACFIDAFSHSWNDYKFYALPEQNHSRRQRRSSVIRGTSLGRTTLVPEMIDRFDRLFNSIT